jgi:hypothetical protein
MNHHARSAQALAGRVDVVDLEREVPKERPTE